MHPGIWTEFSWILYGKCKPTIKVLARLCSHLELGSLFLTYLVVGEFIPCDCRAVVLGFLEATCSALPHGTLRELTSSDPVGGYL